MMNTVSTSGRGSTQGRAARVQQRSCSRGSASIFCCTAACRVSHAQLLADRVLCSVRRVAHSSHLELLLAVLHLRLLGVWGWPSAKG